MNSESPKFSIRFLLAITAMAAIPTAGITCVANQHKARRLKVAQLEKQDAETLKQIVIDVEEVRAKIGRVPESQAELETLLGRKLPYIHDRLYPSVRPMPINYWRTDDDSYKLQYELQVTAYWIFDSRDPGAGWLQHLSFSR